MQCRSSLRRPCLAVGAFLLPTTIAPDALPSDVPALRPVAPNPACHLERNRVRAPAGWDFPPRAPGHRPFPLSPAAGERAGVRGPLLQPTG